MVGQAIGTLVALTLVGGTLLLYRWVRCRRPVMWTVVYRTNRVSFRNHVTLTRHVKSRTSRGAIARVRKSEPYRIFVIRCTKQKDGELTRCVARRP